MAERGTCWSVTWYPEEISMDLENSKVAIDKYAQRQLPPGWVIQGQMEQCPKTQRYHFQAMLKTPQVRKSAVIKEMDRAHIELARGKAALSKYVQKEESRVASVESSQPIPNMYQYQDIIAGLYDEEECARFLTSRLRATEGNEDWRESFVKYIDTLVAKDVRDGRRGAEFIAINPMWRSSWKLFGQDIIARYKNLNSEYNGKNEQVQERDEEIFKESESSKESHSE